VTSSHATRRPGDLATWRPGDLATWRQSEAQGTTCACVHVCACESVCVCLKRRGAEFQAHQPRLMRRSPLSRHGSPLARGVIGYPPFPFGCRARRAGDEMPPRPPPSSCGPPPVAPPGAPGAAVTKSCVSPASGSSLLHPPGYIIAAPSCLSFCTHSLCTFARSLFHARFVAPTLITLHHACR
jgi:hypothetical protein